MKKSLFAAFAAASLLQLAAAAQPAPSPAEFVAKASASGMAEVELGKLAAEKGSSEDVRKYGQQMVTDHGKANTELLGIASKKSLNPTSTLNPAHATALTQLRTKSGKDFDAAYAQQMVKDHEEAVALFTAASSTTDAELAAFARKTLPVLKQHHEHATQLVKR